MLCVRVTRKRLDRGIWSGAGGVREESWRLKQTSRISNLSSPTAEPTLFTIRLFAAPLEDSHHSPWVLSPKLAPPPMASPPLSCSSSRLQAPSSMPWVQAEDPLLYGLMRSRAGGRLQGLLTQCSTDAGRGLTKGHQEEGTQQPEHRAFRDKKEAQSWDPNIGQKVGGGWTGPHFWNRWWESRSPTVQGHGFSHIPRPRPHPLQKGK